MFCTTDTSVQKSNITFFCFFFSENMSGFLYLRPVRGQREVWMYRQRNSSWECCFFLLRGLFCYIDMIEANKVGIWGNSKLGSLW